MGLVPLVNQTGTKRMASLNVEMSEEMSVPRAAICALQEKQSVNADDASPGQRGFPNVGPAALNPLFKHDAILKARLEAGSNVSLKWENNSPLLELPSLFPLGLAADTFG